MKEYMSGDELYRYLHISKRKMKYLLENGYIPMTDTGMKTHRYRIKYEDARAFKRKIKMEPGCLSELTGMFNTRCPRKKTPLLLEPTEKNCRAFREYLTKLWEDKPEALSVSDMATLTGLSKNYISSLCSRMVLWSTVIQGKRYCSKESLIAYFSCIEMVTRPNKTNQHRIILYDFIKQRK